MSTLILSVIDNLIIDKYLFVTLYCLCYRLKYDCANQLKAKKILLQIIYIPIDKAIRCMVLCVCINTLYGDFTWQRKMEEKLKKLIDETLELRRVWERRRIETENQIRFLDAKLSAYQATLKDYWEYLDLEDKK